MRDPFVGSVVGFDAFMGAYFKHYWRALAVAKDGFVPTKVFYIKIGKFL